MGMKKDCLLHTYGRKLVKYTFQGNLLLKNFPLSSSFSFTSVNFFFLEFCINNLTSPLLIQILASQFLGKLFYLSLLKVFQWKLNH